MKFATLITIFSWSWVIHLVSSKPITAFFLPGELEDYVKMTRHPGTDLSEISICLRLIDTGYTLSCIVAVDKSVTRQFFRYYSVQFPKAGIGNMVILASIMEGEGAGIKDEYLTLYLGSEDGEKDDFGREVGSYLMATKGDMLS